jgi:hypothetical protein
MAIGAASLAALLISTTSGCSADTGSASPAAAPVRFARAAVEAPAAGPAILSPRAPTLPSPGTSIILSERKSKAIVAALKAGGTGAAIATCTAILPPEFKDQCSIIIGTLAAGLGVFADLKAGNCIKLTVKLGFPPLRVSIVPCPPPRPPADADTDTYSFGPASGLLGQGEVVIPSAPGGILRSGGIGGIVGLPGGLGVLFP